MSETAYNVDQAITLALEESQEAVQGSREPRRTGHIFTLALMAVFFLVMMGSLTAGATIYRNVASVRNQTDDLHLQSGLMVNIVRMNDMADAVTTAPGPEGEALVLVEELESGTYETRVYHYQGAIVQEYAIQGRPFNPDNAVKIVDSATFAFQFEDGLLSIQTDDGTFHAALRSQQGGAS